MGIRPQYFMANRRGKGERSGSFLLIGLSNHCGSWLQPWNKKTIASWQESYAKPRQCIGKQRHYSADKGPCSQGHGFLSGHVWLWELDHKEGRMMKNWCLPTVVWRRLLKVHWTARRSNQSNFREINPVYSLEGLMLKLKLQYFGHLMQRTDSLEKVSNVGKDWGQKEKRVSEDDMAGWYYRCKTWTWANFGRSWGTGRPHVLPSMGLQGVGHEWVTELNWYSVWLDFVENFASVFINNMSL